MKHSAIIDAYKRKNERILASLFAEQRAAVDDPAKKKAYLTTRRAGKTTAAISDICTDARMYPGIAYAYIALTQPQAEGIAWPILKQLDQRFSLGIAFREAKLKAIFPNGSWVRLYGADKPNWMSRLYGHKFRKIYIDEAAFFKIPLRPLIDDVLNPTIADLDGQIILTSTPGFITKGLFYDVTAKNNVPGWSIHRWNTFDNPHMKTQFQRQIDELTKNNPDVTNDPWFRRNYLGEWVTEFGERVYKFDVERNGVYAWERTKKDHYVIGVDLGWGDSTAFSVIVWRDDSPDIVEVESFKKSEMRLEEVGQMIRTYMDVYKGCQIVADPGHRQAFEEVRRRFRLPIMEAEKYGKMDFIEIVNSDLLSGRIKILDPEASPHVEEMVDLVWRVFPSGKRTEQPGMPNDCCDAFLYAARHARHYLYKEDPPQLVKGTIEFENQRILEHERRMFDEARKRFMGDQKSYY